MNKRMLKKRVELMDDAEVGGIRVGAQCKFFNKH